MNELVAIVMLGLPGAIFFLAARAVVVRLRLERDGVRTRASIVSVRPWHDDTDHLEVTYRFLANGCEYHGSADLGGSSRVAVGDPIEVLCRPDRPTSSQPLRGGVPGMIGLNLFVMAAMLALDGWMVSLLQSASH